MLFWLPEQISTEEIVDRGAASYARQNVNEKHDSLNRLDQCDITSFLENGGCEMVPLCGR